MAIANGSALIRLHRYNEAEVYYNMGMKLWKPSSSVIGKAWVHHGLSAVHGFCGAWDKALDDATHACEIYALANSVLYWDALQNMGIIYKELGNKKLALEHLTRCYQHWEQVGDSLRQNDIMIEVISLEKI